MKRKHGVFFGFAVMIITAIFTLTGCDNGTGGGGGNGNGDSDGPFTVSFIANGGTPAPAEQTVVKGSTATLPPAMTNTNHEDFNGWFTNAACTTPFNFSTPITANITLYAKWGYVVGDTGPAGGKVFYVKSSEVYPNWKYLEASPAELGKCKWAEYSYKDSDDSEKLAFDYVIEGAKATAIGTGKANTAAILQIKSFPQYSNLPTPQVPAAQGAEDYSTGGYSDWFLPSKDELNALFQSHVLSFSFSSPTAHYYWSSSQHDDPGRNQCAWAQDFGSADPGMQNEENKDGTGDRTYVRPVRSFFNKTN
jgi:uncharacterized repeat protein (TIGR02543 family)